MPPKRKKASSAATSPLPTSRSTVTQPQQQQLRDELLRIAQGLVSDSSFLSSTSDGGANGTMIDDMEQWQEDARHIAQALLNILPDDAQHRLRSSLCPTDTTTTPCLLDAVTTAVLSARHRNGDKQQQFSGDGGSGAFLELLINELRSADIDIAASSSSSSTSPSTVRSRKKTTKTTLPSIGNSTSAAATAAAKVRAATTTTTTAATAAAVSSSKAATARETTQERDQRQRRQQQQQVFSKAKTAVLGIVVVFILLILVLSGYEDDDDEEEDGDDDNEADQDDQDYDEGKLSGSGQQLHRQPPPPPPSNIEKHLRKLLIDDADDDVDASYDNSALLSTSTPISSDSSSSSSPSSRLDQKSEESGGVVLLQRIKQREDRLLQLRQPEASVGELASQKKKPIWYQMRILHVVARAAWRYALRVVDYSPFDGVAYTSGPYGAPVRVAVLTGSGAGGSSRNGNDHASGSDSPAEPRSSSPHQGKEWFKLMVDYILAMLEGETKTEMSVGRDICFIELGEGEGSGSESAHNDLQKEKNKEKKGLVPQLREWYQSSMDARLRNNPDGERSSYKQRGGAGAGSDETYCSRTRRNYVVISIPDLSVVDPADLMQLKGIIEYGDAGGGERVIPCPYGVTVFIRADDKDELYRWVSTSTSDASRGHLDRVRHLFSKDSSILDQSSASV